VTSQVLGTPLEARTTDDRERAFRRWLGASAVAVVAAIAVQIVFLRNSWFYLDDVRDISAARGGLSWDLLTRPIAEHLTVGHRLLDWIVAVPLGRHWAGAVAVVVVWATVALGYLSLCLRQLFGTHARLAIPVVLAGTAWPLLGTGRWFSGAALVIPMMAAMAGAAFHHLRWRAGAGRAHWAGALAWTAVGLLFSVQVVFFAPLLLLVALVQRPEILRDRAAALREVVAVIPVALPGLALSLYERGQSWAPETTIPSFADTVDLFRVIVVRGVMPSIVGVGMDGSPPDPRVESTMQLLAGIVVVALLVAAVLLRHRWIAAIALFAGGVAIAGIAIAIARLDELGPVVAGTEPRYLLPAVLLGALAIGALISPQRPQRPPRVSIALPRGVIVGATAVTALAAVVLYAANLDHTRDERRVSLDFASATRMMTERLEHDLAAAETDGLADSIVDGKLPYPLFYQNDPRNRLSGYGAFFAAGGVKTPGIPHDGTLLQVAADGTLARVRFQPTGRPTSCERADRCVVAVPADTDPVYIEVTTAAGPAQRRVIAAAVDPGATTFVVTPRDGERLRSAVVGTLIPAT
jgi:hypothetical protein